MEKVLDPVSVDLLKAELTPDKKLCNTNKAGNEIYVIDGTDAPNVLLEIGRLREIAFRDSGGGTGLSVDLDEFDTTTDHPYKQIIIWDPEASAIIGGYRFILGPDMSAPWARERPGACRPCTRASCPATKTWRVTGVSS